MPDLLRLWRSLPRGVIGLLLMIEVACLAIGPGLPQLTVAVLRGARTLLGEGTFGVLLGATVIVLAAFGSEAARALLLPLRLFVSAVLRLLPQNTSTRIGRACWTLSQPVGAVASRIFAANDRLLDDMNRGWSLAVTDSSDFYAVVDRNWSTIFDLARRTIKGFAETGDDLWNFIYYGHVTQEQVFADYIETQLEVVQSAWLAVALAPAVVWQMGGSFRDVVPATVVAAVASLLLLPTYLRRKTAYATYLLYVNLAAFNFGDTPEVADRDPES